VLAFSPNEANVVLLQRRAAKSGCATRTRRHDESSCHMFVTRILRDSEAWRDGKMCNDEIRKY